MVNLFDDVILILFCGFTALLERMVICKSNHYYILIYHISNCWGVWVKKHRSIDWPLRNREWQFTLTTVLITHTNLWRNMAARIHQTILVNFMIYQISYSKLPTICHCPLFQMQCWDLGRPWQIPVVIPLPIIIHFVFSILHISMKCQIRHFTKIGWWFLLEQ